MTLNWNIADLNLAGTHGLKGCEMLLRYHTGTVGGILLIAYYGYYSLSEAIELFAGSYPSHKILMGLSYLDELVAQLSPLHHSEYDEDDIENAEYITILNTNYLGLMDKALLLMGEGH